MTGEGAAVERFRCTGCGECCRLHRVPATVADLARLRATTGEPVASLVELLGPDDVDMTGEPESFAVTREGRRLAVLAFAGGACRFLVGDRCSVHAARPAACRTFPLELAAPARGAADGVVRRLTLLPDSGCPGELDGPAAEEEHVAALSIRSAELAAHAATVEAWNRRQRRRTLANARPEPPSAWLELLERASEPAAGTAGPVTVE